MVESSLAISCFVACVFVVILVLRERGKELNQRKADVFLNALDKGKSTFRELADEMEKATSIPEMPECRIQEPCFPVYFVAFSWGYKVFSNAIITDTLIENMDDLKRVQEMLERDCMKEFKLKDAPDGRLNIYHISILPKRKDLEPSIILNNFSADTDIKSKKIEKLRDEKEELKEESQRLRKECRRLDEENAELKEKNRLANNQIEHLMEIIESQRDGTTLQNHNLWKIKKDWMQDRAKILKQIEITEMQIKEMKKIREELFPPPPPPPPPDRTIKEGAEPEKPTIKRGRIIKEDGKVVFKYPTADKIECPECKEKLDYMTMHGAIAGDGLPETYTCEKCGITFSMKYVQSFWEVRKDA